MSGPGASNTQLLVSNLFSVEGITAVVTGGGTGIGLMIAHALSANGAKVYIVGRREEELKKVADMYTPSGNGAIIPLPGDVSTKDGCIKLAEALKLKESCIHLLVNNAGVAKEMDSKDEYTSGDLSFESAEAISEHMLSKNSNEQWDTTLRINSQGPFFMSAAFLPLLVKGHETFKGYTSSIVNITSISGLMKGPSMGQYAYSASKAAAIQTTKNLANVLVKTKIRVNTIAPGIFPSEMTAGESDSNNKSELPDAGKGLPAGRPGKDEDMAGSILFLASRAAIFYNGQIIHPDGGALLTNPASL